MTSPLFQTPSAPKTAVVVDDELITRMDFSGMLSDMGYLVVGEAADGFDAVELCRDKRPDFVLMDISMPIFNGLTATEQIIADGLSKTVIILSAFCDEPTVKKAAALGVRAYLVKPVDKNALFAAVETALASAGREKELLARASAAENALNEMKLIDRAKRALAESEAVSESEAYRKIQKLSMDKRCPMATVAESILKNREDTAAVQKAKAALMATGMSESGAFRRISAYAEETGLSMGDAALAILRKGGANR